MSIRLLLFVSALTVGSAQRQPVFTDGVAALADGRSARVSLVSDDDCDFIEDTTTLPDGSTSHILKDFSVGKSALLLSNEPNVCYIREIPYGEMRSHSQRCEHGVVVFKPTETLPGARTYREGGELSASDISPDLAEFCGDRRIVELVTVVVPNAVEVRHKRCIENIVRVCQDVLCCCREVCKKYGWFFRRNKCVRKETECSTTEKCETKIERIGC